MYKKPEYVSNWESHPYKPLCCHTCSSFVNCDIPYCMKWGEDNPVPEDFAAREEVCSAWTDPEGGMPF